MSTGNVFLSVLAGLAAGATLGVLFAPDKGSKTRKKLLLKSNQYEDELEEKFSEIVDDISKKFKALKEETAHMSENGRPRAELSTSKR